MCDRNANREMVPTDSNFNRFGFADTDCSWSSGICSAVADCQAQALCGFIGTSKEKTIKIPEKQVDDWTQCKIQSCSCNNAEISRGAFMNRFCQSVLSSEKGVVYLFSLGQAGFIVKSKAGQLLGIDLYLSDCVERVEGHAGFKRLLPRILDPHELVFDAVVATHSHRDHLDIDAMPDIMSNGYTRLYAALDCIRDVEQLHIAKDKCSFVKPGDRFHCGDFVLDFVNCDHGKGTPEAVGLIVTVDEKRVFFAGDTCLRLDRIEEYRQKGPLDILIAPINGAYGNLNEKECTQLADSLRPKLTIPCHYGMFASHGGNPGVFRDLMIEKNLGYFLMTMGEKIAL